MYNIIYILYVFDQNENYKIELAQMSLKRICIPFTPQYIYHRILSQTQPLSITNSIMESMVILQIQIINQKL